MMSSVGQSMRYCFLYYDKAVDGGNGGALLPDGSMHQTLR